VANCTLRPRVVQAHSSETTSFLSSSSHCRHHAGIICSLRFSTPNDEPTAVVFLVEDGRVVVDAWLAARANLDLRASYKSTFKHAASPTNASLAQASEQMGGNNAPDAFFQPHTPHLPFRARAQKGGRRSRRRRALEMDPPTPCPTAGLRGLAVVAGFAESLQVILLKEQTGVAATLRDVLPSVNNVVGDGAG
jgi:hypothetical protein